MEFHDDSIAFKTYSSMDGLQGEIFNEGAAMVTSDGMLIFGGQNGFTIFDPENIEVENEPINLIFTDFFVSNKRINPGEVVDDRVILPYGLSSTQEVVLEYNQNSFAIGFTAPVFFQPAKTRFQYKSGRI